MTDTLTAVSHVADTLTLVGLIASVIGGAVGAFSVFVTWKLYQASNAVNLKTIEVLHDVQQSSHTTEVTATRYTERMVTTLIALVERNVTASLASGQDSITERIDAAIKEQLAGVNQDIAEKVRSRVREDIKDTFKTLQLQTAAVAQIAEHPAPFPAEVPAVTSSTPLDPGAPKVIRWIARNEAKYAFLSVKFLRDKIFAHDPEAQRGLAYCIDKALLELHDQPNPKDPAHSTKACRLNRRHPVTLDMLR